MGPQDKGSTLFRFGIVGLVTAAIFYVLLGIQVELLGFSATMASSIAYPFVVAFNYLAHFQWTYRATGRHATALLRYVVMIAAGFLLNALIMFGGTELLEFNYLLVQAIAIGMVISLNFVMSFYWVFR